MVFWVAAAVLEAVAVGSTSPPVAWVPVVPVAVADTPAVFEPQAAGNPAWGFCDTFHLVVEYSDYTQFSSPRQ